MKNLADFKRIAIVGETFTAYWPDSDRELTRQIAHRQTNAIRFEGGSWFWFPLAGLLEFRQGCLIEFNDPEKWGYSAECRTPILVYCQGQEIPEAVKSYCLDVHQNGARAEERERLAQLKHFQQTG